MEKQTQPNKIAIIAVTFNRIDSLQRLLASLEHAHYTEEVSLIISVDKSDIDEVASFANQYCWPHGEKMVVLQPRNLGLRSHMLSLGQHFSKFDALVVLEDDVSVSPAFYDYVKACFSRYSDDDRIAGISLYAHAVCNQNDLPFIPAKSEFDVYFMHYAASWGEVWMKRQWCAFYEWYQSHSDEFYLDNLPPCINRWPKTSWLKYHIRYCIETQKYFVYPYSSYSTNNADSGVHFHYSDTLYQSVLQVTPQTAFRLPSLDESIIRYDGFFEPEYLAPYLFVDDKDLCVDLYGMKHPNLYRRYLLSTQSHPYRIVRSFALELRPIEMNIIQNQQGQGIWLYDTTESAIAPKVDAYQRYYYLYGKAFYRAIFMLGGCKIIKLLLDLIAYKLNKVFHWHLPCHLN
ncbi:MAG: glycosyltransferase [Bacteroidaceae bacterium]|nr:glycosyltransferase [Bacteroidaceae bacterium]